MPNIIDIKHSVENLQVNVQDLLNDVNDFDEHEHDKDGCTECETIFDEGKEEHDHDTWGCTSCEDMAHDYAQERIKDLAIYDLKEYNYSLYSEIADKAKEEYDDEQEDQRKEMQDRQDALNEVLIAVGQMAADLDGIPADRITLLLTAIYDQVYGGSAYSTLADVPQQTTSLDEKMDQRTSAPCDCSACK